jgi:anti-sigma factor (TIGR02949 family)
MSVSLSEPKKACLEAERRLQAYVDRQLTVAEIEDIELHLASCERCADCYRFEQHVWEHVRRLCVAEPCPEHLKLRLRSLCSGCDPHGGLVN